MADRTDTSVDDASADASTGVAPAGGAPRRILIRSGLALAAVAAVAVVAVPPLRAAVLGAAAAGVQTTKERFAGEPLMAKPDPVRGVRVTTVSAAPSAQTRSFTGVVAARYETALGFRVAGKIVRRAVEVGQTVRAGDLLFALDVADFRAAVSAQEATLLAAQAQAAQALADERRQARLLAQGWTTQAAYDRVKAAAETAQNQARAAADRLELARNDLSYAALTAPHDGVVTAIRAEAGQVVPVGQPVLTLVRPGDREALVMAPEGQVADLRDWTATASFWGRSGADEPATLREAAPQADSSSRTYALRFALPASAATAELGATVTVRLRRDGVSAVTLPASAVLFRDGAPLVWRIAATGDRVEAAPVQVARLGAETVDVTGLRTGDSIVTLGAHRLEAGMRVRVVEGTTQPQPAAARIEGGRS